jgi:thiol-disulfide isomerase/thioredoxin
MGENTSKTKAATPFALYIGLAAVSAVVAFGAVYVMLGAPDNDSRSVSGSEVAAPAAKSGVNPLSTGAMTTFVFKPVPEPAPEIAFLDADGKQVTLKDFAGKTVLLNLWATWCAPCRAEMPALQRLQAALGSDKFEVVALAVDKSGLEGAKKFLAENKITGLKLFADPTARESLKLKVIGMPTSILIDAQGREVGRLIGPAEWDSADAKKLIEAQR